jgi:hypothetical protein
MMTSQRVPGRNDCLLSFDMDNIENDAINNSYIVVCIHCHRNIYFGPLPSTDTGIYTHIHRKSRLPTQKLLEEVIFLETNQEGNAEVYTKCLKT